MLTRILPLLILFLGGCGLTQRVTEGTKSALHSVFYKKITVLRLDFSAREALNTDARENNSLSESVVIRIYQLKDDKLFNTLVYQQLLHEADTLLKADLLSSRDVVLKPGGDVSLDMPMETDTQFVAVVGLFRQPDQEKNNWRQVMERDALEPDRARIFDAGSHYLTLRPLED